MFSEDPQIVSRKLDRISRELRAHRQRISGRSDDQKFSYAEPIYEVGSDFRDDFFETMETLVDRHASDLVRVKAIQIFLEFGAIEASSQGETPFGLNALISLGNIMRSSRSLEDIFVTQCIQEPFSPIINNMSIEYLGVVAKEIAVWTQASNFRMELADGFADCAKKLAKAHQVILPRAQLWWERATENNDDWKSQPDIAAFNYISQIINFTCISPKTAMRYVPELPIVLYTKVEVFNRIRPSYIRNGYVFPPFKIIASLAKVVSQAAEFFAGTNWDKKVVGADAYTYYQQLRPALQYQRMMRHLLSQFDVLLWEERDNVGELVSVAYNVDTLFAIMFHSSKAVTEFIEDHKQQKAKAQNATTRTPIGVQLLRRSVEFAQTSGELANACLRGFLLLINRNAPQAALLAEIREEIEAHITEVSRLIQESAHKLLTTTTDQQTEATKYALMAVLEIISAFNHPSYAHIARTVSQEYVKNYSRDSIIFNVLDAEGAGKGNMEGSGAAKFIDDDVRLSAAQCLATIDVSSFSQQGIQYLLDLFSAVPTVITPTRFQVMTTLMYFMFKLAVHDNDADNTAQNSGSGTNAAENQPGRVFRSLYASEISNCIFTLLERLVIEGSPEQASYWETRFMQSCVKFLMSSWVKYEFHADNLGQRPVEIMTAIAIKEQQRINALNIQFDERKKRYYRLIEQRRCVVSEDDLSTEDQTVMSVGQPGAYRLPSIRLKRYEHVNLSQVIYQHSFLEQTSLGARVSYLYPIIPQLKKIDIIAFRIIHQLANVVDDVSFASTVASLSQMEFNQWNTADPGKAVTQCDTDEQKLFNAMGSSVHSSHLFHVVPVTKDILPRISRLYDAYSKTMRKDDSKKMDEVVKFEDIWREYEKDDRAIALVVTQGRDVIAAAFAKPYSNFQRDFPDKFTLKALAHVDMEAEARKLESVKHIPGSGNAVIEHYFFSPELKGQVNEMHKQLLAAVSHAVYIRGFCKCFFIADRNMRNILSASGASLCSADEFKGDQNGRYSAFYWFTSQNIWCFRPDHEFFVQNKIPETLLQLLLDDQNKIKMEDMKRQGKLPSQKNIIKRFKPKIRIKMEEYGGQLTTEFELTTPATAGEDFVHLDTENAQKSSTERLKRFQLLVEKEFKYGLVAAGKNAYGTATSNTPVWEKIISGSKEETVIECMARVTPAAATAPQPLLAAALLSQLPPDLNPRTNPDTWTNEWMTKELEAAAHEGIEGSAGADSKTVQKDLEQELKRRRRELAEQDAMRQKDEEEAERRRKEWVAPPVLQSWVVPSTAAVLRTMHTILTQSQQSTYKEVLKNLIVVPQDGLGMLEALKAVLTAFHYQLRGSVLDHLPASNYNIALKALDVIVCSLGTVSSGLDAALAALEYVELCLELVKDICRLIFNLIQSRNTTYTAAANQGTATVPKKRTPLALETETPPADGSASPETPTTPSSPSAPAAGAAAATEAPAVQLESAVPKTGIHPQEERVMAAVCKTLSALVTQVSHVTLFKGSSVLISEGNRKCRQHAQQQLFTNSKIICDTVLAILLYDLEKENEVDEKIIDSETRNKSNPSLRDQARVYATELLAHFMHVDSEYRYSFFNEFCVSSIKAERSLRASFIQQVIATSTLLQFKEKLEPFLRSRRMLAQEEYILRFAFMEHAEVERGKEYDGTKLVLVTNHAYYISTDSFPEDIESHMLDYMTDDKLVDFVYLERREYADIIRLYRDFSSQVIAIRSYSQSAQARLMDSDITKRTDVFLHRGQGVADGIVSAMARCARDDTNRVHAIAMDEFTPAAMLPLLESCSTDSSSRMTANTTVRLMTHVWVIRRDATIVKRVMMWVTDNSNVSNSMIIITPYSPKHWDVSAGGEDLEDISYAGPWEPCKYPKLQKPSEKLAENAKSECITSLFSVSSPSVLPKFMSAMPALPFGSLSQGGPFYFPVSEIQSVDFTEDADTDMVIRIRRTDPSRIPSVYVRFADDTGREMWRRELKKLFFGGAIGRWQENILPDLSHNSRRKQELL